MPSLAFFLLILFFRETFSGASTCGDTIRICQSAPLTGPTKGPGIGMYVGISAAFEEANVDGGIAGGSRLELSVLDDGADPERMQQNVQSFLDDGDCFGFTGFFGTHSISTVKDQLVNSSLPIIGFMTGAQLLRRPFRREFVNIRPSYRDEASALVRYVIRKRHRTRIAVIHQDDAGGIAVREAIERALAPFGPRLVATSVYDGDTKNAAEAISSENPDAIFLVAPASIVAETIVLIRTELSSHFHFPDEILFLAFSPVGTVSLARSLELNQTENGPDLLQDVIVSEVVPNVVEEDAHPAVHTFRVAMEAIGETRNISFSSFEGYLIGVFIRKALQSVRGDLNVSNFLDSVYVQERVFHQDEVLFGPFSCGSGNSLMCLPEEEIVGFNLTDSCTQGLRNVYLVEMKTSSFFKTALVYSWDGVCEAAVTVSETPLILTLYQSTEKNISLFGLGMEAAFLQFNLELDGNLDLYRGMVVNMEWKSNENSPDLVRNQTEEFLNHSSFLVGFDGEMARIGYDYMKTFSQESLFLFPRTGSSALHARSLANVVNLRLGWEYETTALVQFLLNEKLVRSISIVYDDSTGEFPRTVLDWLRQKLSHIHASALSQDIDLLQSEVSFGSSIYAAAQLVRAVDGLPDAIIILSSSIPSVREFIVEYETLMYATESFPYFALLGSTINSHAFALALEEEYSKNIVFTDAIPHYNNTNSKLVKKYHEMVEEYWAVPEYHEYFSSESFEGFLAGRLVATVLADLFQLGIRPTAQSFSERLFELTQDDTFKLDEEIPIAAYVPGCNDAGIRSINFVELIKGSISPIATITYDTRESDGLRCFARPPDLSVPYLFGTSLDLRPGPIGERNEEYVDGMECALLKFYNENGLNFRVVAENDNGDSQQMAVNVEHLNSLGVLSIVGTELEDTSNYRLLAPRRSLLSYHDDPNTLLLQPFLFDEALRLVEIMFHESGVLTFVIIHRRDELIDEVSKLRMSHSKHLFFETCPIDSVGSIYACADKILSMKSVGVICGVDTNELSEILTLVGRKKMQLGILSYVDVHDLEFLDMYNDTLKVLRSRVLSVPSVKDPIKTSLYRQYESDGCHLEMDHTEAPFSGYVTGLLIGKVGLLQSPERDQLSFFDRLAHSSPTLPGIQLQFSDECHVGYRHIDILNSAGGIVASPEDYADVDCTAASLFGSSVSSTVNAGFFAVLAVIVSMLLIVVMITQINSIRSRMYRRCSWATCCFSREDVEDGLLRENRYKETSDDGTVRQSVVGRLREGLLSMKGLSSVVAADEKEEEFEEENALALLSS